MHKSCSKCGQTKPSPEGFYKDATRKDGLTLWCKECCRAAYVNSAPSISAKKAAAYKNDPTAAKSRAAKRRALKREDIKDHKRQQFASLSIDRKHARFEALRQWKAANPAKVLANTRRRQTRKMQACPAWLTEPQRRAILEFYKAAENLYKTFGVKFHVDHIVPLRGGTVCGLHVPWNLQLLSAVDNIKKRNSLWPDKP